MSELLLGVRLAFTGGRDGRLRAALTALGVGIGVALLLLAASVPHALQAREARGDARDDMAAGTISAGADTLLIRSVDTDFRGQPVRGRLLRPEGPQAPKPPGVVALPRAGEVVVSPALKDLLDSPDGQLFVPRLGGAEVVGTIGEEGLIGPRELAFYLGSDTLSADLATRLDRFGSRGAPGREFGPTLILLVVIIFVVLLLPIAVFLGAAVRFGGERRDRRLAALRLVGADSGMIRRIAVGEATAGALLGVAVGGVLFALGRQLAPLIGFWNISVYARDLRPSLPLVAVIVVAVPAIAVAVALITLRGVVVEPLGVTRRATPTRRRLWWRLAVPVAGLAVLAPLLSGIRNADGPMTNYQVAVGVVLLLIGAVALLPWLIDLVVRPLRGGPVPWLLAVRRLQLDSATSARMVNGITVAVAGAIGLQMLFAVAQAENTSPTRYDPKRAQAYANIYQVTDAPQALATLAKTPGVAGSVGTLTTRAFVERPADVTADEPPPDVELRIGDCAALAEFIAVDSCTDGDVFIAPGPPGSASVDAFTPGARLTVGEKGWPWRIPTDARRVPSREDPAGWSRSGIYVTPGAIDVAALGPLTVSLFVTTDPAEPDALEHLRNTAASIDPLAYVYEFSATFESRQFANVRRGLYIGTVLTLLLIGASLLVGLLEQLRERRRLLAMLVAVGTPRRTLTWSVFWQTVVPVLVGLALAVVFGLAFGAVLMRMVNAPFAINWMVVGSSTALAAGTIVLVTASGMPALWRLMRPDSLRTE